MSTELQVDLKKFVQRTFGLGNSKKPGKMNIFLSQQMKLFKGIYKFNLFSYL